MSNKSNESWEELEAKIRVFGEEVKNLNKIREEKNKMDYKEMKKAVFEGTMAANAKKIRFFDMGDLWECVSNPDKMKDMTQDEYEFYKNDIQVQLKKKDDLDKAESQNKINDYRFTVESDKQKAIEKMISKQKTLPINVRINEHDIIKEISGLVNRYSGMGSMEYRDKLSDYIGEKITGDGEGDNSYENKIKKFIPGFNNTPKGE